jgi:hypothetical protein
MFCPSDWLRKTTSSVVVERDPGARKKEQKDRRSHIASTMDDDAFANRLQHSLTVRAQESRIYDWLTPTGTPVLPIQLEITLYYADVLFGVAKASNSRKWHFIPDHFSSWIEYGSDHDGFSMLDGGGKLLWSQGLSRSCREIGARTS